MSPIYLDKEALRLLLINNQLMDLPDSPIIEESMQRDNNDNRDELIKKLSEDLERAKRQIENQTRTIDRIMQSLDSKDKSIADLKLDATILKVGFQNAMKKKWIELCGEKKEKVKRVVDKVEDEGVKVLQNLKDNPDES